ncbi:NB-ARC domain-containing protein [Streptosporangium sp. NPDC000563]|uniref:ATP-binding protein n=1 Tax=Streptosporangium sp. NPDC000563 TaxID=3154366 RepID=UPI00332A8FFD
MEQTRWWRGNLPAETNDLIGREGEVRRLLKLLADTPLVTVTGVGGIGKSRIAVRAAREREEHHPDGTWLVELSGERDGDLLAHTVAAVLGLPERSARSQAETLVEFLAGRRLLLILDACEHLLPACRALVREILAGAPGVRIVTTSRRPLGLPQEALLPVGPFEAPAPGPPVRWPEGAVPEGALLEGAGADDALRLFLDRARSVVPGLETTEAGVAAAARICRRLDGVPLAVELAAGGLGSLPVERLADHLEDHFEIPHGRTPAPRHRIVRAAISWSHELCDPRERLLWARLSVFAGDFDVAAAEWVCGDDPLSGVPDLLESLERRFLLVPVPGGYRQPSTVREYGRERLALLGEEARLTRRHRYHYLELARRAEADWYGPGQEEWAARLAFSMTDLRLALDPASPTSVELAGTLWILWFCLGRLNEGRHHMARAIEAAPVTDPGLPRLLWADGCVAIAQGEPEVGRRRAEAALSAALDWGDYAAAGHAQLRLASSSLCAGALEDVEPRVELVREYFRRAEAATVSEPLALVTAATAVTWRGEFARAVSVLKEAQRLCDARGERWARACGDYVLSIAQLGLGRVDEAAEAARQSLDVKWRLRDATGVALAVDQLAVIAAVEGDGRRTARLQGAGVRLWATFGLQGFGSEGMSEPRTVAERTARQLLGDETYDAVFAEGYQADPEEAVAYALHRDEAVAHALHGKVLRELL